MQEEKKILMSVEIMDNFIKAKNNVDFWKEALKEAQKDSKTTQADLREIASELTNASIGYREAKKSIESVAKTQQVFNTIVDDSTKTLGEMQRELAALRNTPLSVLSDEETQLIKQRMADLTSTIQNVKNEIKGLDTSKIWSNLASGMTTAAASAQILSQTFSAVGVENESLKKLQESTIKLIALTQAFGVVTDFLEKKKMKLLVANIAVINSRIKQALTIKASTVAVASETAAEDASTLAKIKGAIATKAITAVQWLWNKAILAFPIVSIIVAISALIAAGVWLAKGMKSWSSGADKSGLSFKELEKAIEKTRTQIGKISSDVDFDVAIAEASGASIDELFALRMVAAKTAHEVAEANLKIVSSSKNATKEMLEQAAQLEKEAYTVRKNTLDDWTIAQTRKRTDSGKQAKEDAKQRATAAQDAYLTELNLLYEFQLSRLKLNEIYQNDYTKTISENAALKLQHEIKYETQAFDLKQQFEKQKLEAQRKFGKISATEHELQLKILDAAQDEFNNTQLDKQQKFYESRKKEIESMFSKNTEALISSLKNDYAIALNDIENDEKMSAEKRQFYIIRLKEEETRKIIDLKKQQSAEINNILSIQYEDDFHRHADNERKKLELEIKMTEEAIEKKKAAGLSTLGDEAKLRSLRLSLNKLTLDTELLQTQGNLSAQYKLRKAALEAELKAIRDNAHEEARIRTSLRDLDVEYTAAKIENVEYWASRTMELMSALNELTAAFASQEIAQAEENNSRQKTALDKRLNSGLISQKKYDKEVKQLDIELDKQKAEIARKQAIREKAMGAFQIGINTAMAIMKIWAEVPKMDFGVSTIALTALVSALGALQLGAILAAPLPKASRGGRILGNSHSAGGAVIEAEGGEYIVNKRSGGLFPELISLINMIGNRGSIPDGGYASRMAMAFPQGGRNNTNNVLSDDFTDKLGDVISERINDKKTYTTVEDVRKGDEAFNTIIDLAKM